MGVLGTVYECGLSDAVVAGLDRLLNELVDESNFVHVHASLS